MNCPKCGKLMSGKFCSFCGAGVGLKNKMTFSLKSKTPFSKSNKTPGMLLKKMWSLSVVAIIIVLITHVISLSPIGSQAKRIEEKWDQHMTSDAHRYRDGDRCFDCEDYEEAQAVNNQQEALLWQSVITDCTLIALAGAAVYGIGTIIERKNI